MGNMGHWASINSSRILVHFCVTGFPSIQVVLHPSLTLTPACPRYRCVPKCARVFVRLRCSSCHYGLHVVVPLFPDRPSDYVGRPGMCWKGFAPCSDRIGVCFCCSVGNCMRVHHSTSRTIGSNPASKHTCAGNSGPRMQPAVHAVRCQYHTPLSQRIWSKQQEQRATKHRTEPFRA